MVSVPYLLQLHPTFSAPRGCPCSSRTVVDLARRGRRFHSLAPPLVQLAEGSAVRLGLDHSRDRQKNAPTPARALLRAWVRMNGEVESTHSPRSGRDATLAWLTVTRVSGAWRGVRRNIRSAVCARIQTIGKRSYEARASDGSRRPRGQSPARSPPSVRSVPTGKVRRSVCRSASRAAGCRR